MPGLRAPCATAGLNAGMQGHLPHPPPLRPAGISLCVTQMLSEHSWNPVPPQAMPVVVVDLPVWGIYLLMHYLGGGNKNCLLQVPGSSTWGMPSSSNQPCLPMHARGSSSPSLWLLESARFFSSGGQLVSQMRALRCQGGFVTAPRAGPAALSCPPPPREPIVPGPSGGCWRQIYRGRRPAGQGLRSAAGRGAGGSAPGTFDPSCCHRRGR